MPTNTATVMPQRAGSRPAVVMAVAVSLLALPSAVLAFTTRLDLPAEEVSGNQGVGSLPPGQNDPRLALAIAARQQAQGSLFRFTPAGIAARPDRSVTVAVNIDSAAARAIVVRASPDARGGTKIAGLPLAPTAYNPVSYTHLDVYKRQAIWGARRESSAAVSTRGKADRSGSACRRASPEGSVNVPPDGEKLWNPRETPRL